MTNEKQASHGCKSCAFQTSVLLPGQLTKQLSCGRYPPKVIPAGQTLMSIFPPVQPDMLCGEYTLSTDKPSEPPLKLVQ